jgi:hypothetical protein
MSSQIFIGSSAEGLKYIEEIKGYLESIGDFITWTTAFTQNKSALDSLVKKTKLTDYAILIATCDDVTLKRGNLETTPRDNIIFEFGLFVGATGIDRAYLLVEEGAKLPTDLEGIVVSEFSNDSAKHNSLEKRCAEISQAIRKEEESSKLGLLPSTALALGYYYSFIKCVCDQIEKTGLITSGDRTVKVKDFEFHVIIPNELDDNGVIDFKLQFNKSKGLVQAQTNVTSPSERGYPFHFKIDPAEQDASQEVEVKLFDIPTTLNTIVESVKVFLPTEKIGPNSDHSYLERRELKNFAKVLRYLVTKNSLTKKHVFITDSVVI